MSVQDRSRKGNGLKRRCMGSSRGSGHLAFQSGDIGPINGESAEGIVSGQGKVDDVVVLEEVAEDFFVRGTE